jgi:hypothetical protein
MTSKTRRFRPSPALVISCLALFMALTGSALAVSVNSVRSAQIVDRTVRTVDLHDNAVKSPKVADGSLTADDLGTDSVGSDEIAANAVGSSEVAADSLTTTDLGPSSVGSSELGTVTVRTNSTALKAGDNGSVTASCLAGEQVLSGGGQPAHFGVEMTSSRPSGNGWLYQARNNNGSDSTITAYALCLG